VAAGFTPSEALATATILPARFLGKENAYGSVARGKTADLVLLDADPTKDIRNTRKIAAVVANGRLFTRADLDGVLAGVAKYAKGH
jgi:imidazolonepropionase-like amidohydrolase